MDILIKSFTQGVSPVHAAGFDPAILNNFARVFCSRPPSGIPTDGISQLLQNFLRPNQGC